MCTKILRNFGAKNLGTLCLETESTFTNCTQRNYDNGNQQRSSSQSKHSRVLLEKFQLPIDQLGKRQQHDWRRQMDVNQQRRKTIPKLVYLHNPWKYLVTKFNLWKLKWFWDRDFNESEFIEGSKQAAVVMTDIIRQQSAEQISELTTPVGFQQITRDMLLSRDDTRLKLVRFEKEHLRRAIPMKVATRQNFGRRYAFIDMLFVGLRNTKDFDSPVEAVEINDIIRRMDDELKTPSFMINVPHRIVFAEIFIRFRRDYTTDARRQDGRMFPQKSTPLTTPQAEKQARNGAAITPESKASRLTQRQLMEDRSWAVSFYKILTFDVLNYDPNPGKQGR